MARKHEKIIESNSDSSENESANEIGSDSDSDSEPKQTQTKSTKKPASSIPAAAKKPSSKPQQPSMTSSESGSDSEPNPKDSPIPTLAAGKKRSAEAKATDGKATKKPKKNAEPEPEVKSIIERFWSEEDELVILQGMIDYTDEKKANPAADMNAFLEFIKKKSLSRNDFNKSQLQNKIKRLKKKYADNKVREEKMEKDGKEMTFSKPHLQSAYGLSKIVWGNKKDVKESNRKAAANKRRSVAVVDA